MHVLDHLLTEVPHLLGTKDTPERCFLPANVIVGSLQFHFRDGTALLKTHRPLVIG